MKLSIAMGSICLALSLVLLAMFVIEEQPTAQSTDEAGNTTTVYLGHGQAHPELDSLLVGGSGAERGESIWGLGVVFGGLQIAFLVCCLLLGVQRKGVIGPAGRFIAAGAVVYILAFAALMLSYRNYMMGDAPATYDGFPQPTAWMLYGVGIAPLLFLFVFVLGFRKYIWDDESERELKKIVEEKRAVENKV